MMEPEYLSSDLSSLRLISPMPLTAARKSTRIRKPGDLNPDIACISIEFHSGHTVTFGFVNFPEPQVQAISELTHRFWPNKTYLHQRGDTAWNFWKLPARSLFSSGRFQDTTRHCVLYLCGLVEELHDHGWAFQQPVCNPLKPASTAKELGRGGCQKVAIQSLAFKFLPPGQPAVVEPHEWIGLSLHALGELLVVGKLPDGLRQGLFAAFFPLSLGHKRYGGGYTRIFYVSRRHLGPRGAEDTTMVRLLDVMTAGGYELYASVPTWPFVMIFRRPAEKKKWNPGLGGFIGGDGGDGMMESDSMATTTTTATATAAAAAVSPAQMVMNTGEGVGEEKGKGVEAERMDSEDVNSTTGVSTPIN